MSSSCLTFLQLPELAQSAAAGASWRHTRGHDWTAVAAHHRGALVKADLRPGLRRAHLVHKLPALSTANVAGDAVGYDPANTIGAVKQVLETRKAIGVHANRTVDELDSLSVLLQHPKRKKLPPLVRDTSHKEHVAFARVVGGALTRAAKQQFNKLVREARAREAAMRAAAVAEERDGRELTHTMLKVRLLRDDAFRHYLAEQQRSNLGRAIELETIDRLSSILRLRESRLHS